MAATNVLSPVKHALDDTPCSETQSPKHPKLASDEVTRAISILNDLFPRTDNSCKDGSENDDEDSDSEDNDDHDPKVHRIAPTSPNHVLQAMDEDAQTKMKELISLLAVIAEEGDLVRLFISSFTSDANTSRVRYMEHLFYIWVDRIRAYNHGKDKYEDRAELYDALGNFFDCCSEENLFAPEKDYGNMKLSRWRRFIAFFIDNEYPDSEVCEAFFDMMMRIEKKRLVVHTFSLSKNKVVKSTCIRKYVTEMFKEDASDHINMVYSCLRERSDNSGCNCGDVDLCKFEPVWMNDITRYLSDNDDE